MASVIKSGAKAFCYIITLPVFIFWNFAPLFFPATPNFLILLLLILAGGSLIAFLTYRAVAHLHAASTVPFPAAATALVQRLDVFLHETRKGSLTMLGLSVLWSLDVLLVSFLAWLDLALGGSVKEALGAAGKGNAFVGVVGVVFVLTSGIVLPALLGLVVVGGARAVWRVAAPRGAMREDREDGFALVGGEDRDDGDGDGDDGWKGV